MHTESGHPHESNLLIAHGMLEGDLAPTLSEVICPTSSTPRSTRCRPRERPPSTTCLPHQAQSISRPTEPKVAFSAFFGQ